MDEPKSSSWILAWNCLSHFFGRFQTGYEPVETGQYLDKVVASRLPDGLELQLLRIPFPFMEQGADLRQQVFRLPALAMRGRSG